MNRNEFMRELELLLADLSQTEKEEALEYYNNYFEDAGPENEEMVIKELGSPAQVAQSIKRDLRADTVESSAKAEDGMLVKYGAGEENETFGLAFTDNENSNDTYYEENPTSSGSYKDVNSSNAYNNGNAYNNNAYNNGMNYKNEYDYTNGDSAGSNSASISSLDKEETQWSGWKKLVIALVIILGVLSLFGKIFKLIGILFGVVFGVFFGWLGIIIGSGAAAFGLLIAAVAIFVAMIGTLFFSPLLALGLLVAFLFCLGFGALSLLVCVGMAGFVTPAAIKGLKKFFGWLKKMIKKAKN